MHRRAGAALIALLFVLAGLALFVGPATAAVPGDGPPDPENDTIGWESGYWHNASLEVDQSDGLSAEERKAIVARTMARVEHIRELEFNRTVPVSVQSREEYRERVQNRSTNETLRVFDNAKFEAMFLIGEAEDSIEVQNQNRGASVLGFYDPRLGEIVLIAENASAARIDESTLAHELVHALQDQHYNLSNYRGQTRDEVNAFDGLIEGDASYVEHLYTNRRCNNPTHPWNGTCVRPPADEGGGGDLANIGVYFVKFQPYSDGPRFIQHVRARGGWETVNDVYANPPASAEQVIHPEEYPDDEPTNVTLSDETSEEWERVRPPDRPDYAELGQAGIASMLVFPLYDSDGQTRTVSPRVWLNLTAGGDVSAFDPLNYGFEAAAGWDGDRLHVYRNAENETAYVWRIAWESTEDMEEFLDAYREVLEYWGGEEVASGTYRIADGGFADAFHVGVTGTTVTIVNAPTVDQLAEVRRGIDAGTETPETTSPPPTTASNSPSVSASPSASPTVDTTPRQSSPTSIPGTATPGQPGFGIAAALLALLIALAVRRR